MFGGGASSVDVLGVEHQELQTAGSRAPLPLRILFALGDFARRKPLGAAGGVLLVLLILVAIFGDVIAPYDPIQTHPAIRLTGPSLAHPFGADELGRDVLSRVISGTRPSIYTSVIVVALSGILGLLIGVASAYRGGVVDLMIQRCVDALMAFPGLILAMALLAVFSSGIHLGWATIPVVWKSIPVMVVITLVVLFIPTNSRVARAATFNVKFSQYVEAARAVGARPWRIILTHLVPNVLAPMIVITTAQLGGVILIEASLSFLGLGLPPPHPSLGGMLQGSGRQYMEQAPWLALFPGLAISASVLGVNLLGDAVRDVSDPRLRGSR
jgi:peptide/nickel transport system permease protein